MLYISRCNPGHHHGATPIMRNLIITHQEKFYHVLLGLYQQLYNEHIFIMVSNVLLLLPGYHQIVFLVCNKDSTMEDNNANHKLEDKLTGKKNPSVSLIYNFNG